MNRNSYWFSYILLMLIVVLSYTGFTFFKIYEYSRLTQEVTPHSIHWAINKIAEDDYTLESVYGFLWNNKNYNGNTSEGIHYLNAWASQEALERINQKTFTVWFDPHEPSFSTLDRSFPLKYAIYAGLLWLLFIYFIWLGYSIKKNPY